MVDVSPHGGGPIELGKGLPRSPQWAKSKGFTGLYLKKKEACVGWIGLPLLFDDATESSVMQMQMNRPNGG